jgi:hypothetical protein
VSPASAAAGGKAKLTRDELIAGLPLRHALRVWLIESHWRAVFDLPGPEPNRWGVESMAWTQVN